MLSTYSECINFQAKAFVANCKRGYDCAGEKGSNLSSILLDTFGTVH